ncbi:phosphosulfolactate synthase [Candidatus Solirubrobacter pratensis]|uniref:phosphosulfolactate synthase n=1 Tax=Candidatus Solirubrobacter pratensis TaxID=1298857 RepID=UPI0003F6E2AC|nr:phosphosulfolactate synthase [Candidatus Solirubrobacter pratensis]
MESIRTFAAAALDGLIPLPERSAKPRTTGVTHVVDPGLTRVEAEGLMEIAAPHVDVIRLGWGSALVTGAVEAKLAVYREHGVAPMLGGTLTELAFCHGRVDALREALTALGIRHVEVSEGTLDMAPGEKRRLIRRLEADFTVFVEVGSKDGRLAPSAEAWVRQAVDALEAGASAVVCEGRVSGDAGLYWPDGSIRDELVGALVEACGGDRLIFEAPRRSQQAWLVRHFGANVNLGNVLPWDLIAVESLRLGLRSDTLTRFHR